MWEEYEDDEKDDDMDGDFWDEIDDLILDEEVEWLDITVDNLFNVIVFSKKRRQLPLRGLFAIMNIIVGGASGSDDLKED